MRITKTTKKRGFILLLLALLVIIATSLRPYDPIEYYERDSGELKTEQVAGERWLVWLYHNPVGEATLWALAKRKMLSTVYGRKMDRGSSAEKIAPFIEDFGIDMKLAQRQEFKSFNDFFTRKLTDEARPIDTSSTVVVSPADGKVLAYADVSKSDFIIKGYRFDVSTFLGDKKLAEKYLDGTLLVVRLAPVDYHRFHFPVSGELSPNYKIEGDYYSVSPFALRKKAEIFCLNKREYTLISSPMFGDVLMAEVGATMVGSIEQSYTGNFAQKGEEKGYFEFGGSTVVLLFEKGKILVDEDFLINTVEGYETTVKMGERIGEQPMGS